MTQINSHQAHVFILGIQHQNQHVIAFFLINSMHKGNEGYKNIQNLVLHTRNALNFSSKHNPSQWVTKLSQTTSQTTQVQGEGMWLYTKIVCQLQQIAMAI